MSSTKPSEKVLRDLEELAKYYGRTVCFKDGEEHPCMEMYDSIIRGDVATGITICNERNNLCVEVQEGSTLKVVELEGNEVFFQVDIGDLVKKGDILAYIITGKGEVRGFRAHDEGYVVFIHEDPIARPMRYTLVLGSRGVRVRELGGG